MPLIAWGPIEAYQKFAAEVLNGSPVSAVLAAVMRAAGYPDVTAAAISQYIVQVHSAMQHPVESPFAKLSGTSAVIQRLVLQSLLSDGFSGSEEEAKAVAAAATKVLFDKPSADETIASDPAAFAVTAAVMAAQGPILDPHCMQETLQFAQQVASQPSASPADMFAAVPIIAQLVKRAVSSNTSGSSC